MQGSVSSRRSMQAISMRGLLLRSLKHKPGRIAAAVLGLTVSAAIATAMLTLSLDITEKLHHEFRSFGANVVVTTADKTAFPEDALVKIQSAGGSDAVAAPFAYAVMKTDRGTDVVVAGTDFGAVKKLDSWWQLTAWPTAQNDSLLGEKASQFIRNQSDVKLSYDGRTLLLHSIGQLRTGGEEESRIYVSLPTLESFAHVAPSVIEVRVGGDAAAVEAAAARMRESLPGLTVTPVRQLVDSESRIVGRMRALLLASVVLIALTVGVAVLATMSSSVLERRRDFALMHALGSRRNQILLLFVAEAMAIAFVGVVAGYLLGSLAAWGIGELNFHTATLPRASVLPVVFVMNLLIAFVAAMLPARALRALQPAALLRGE